MAPHARLTSARLPTRRDGENYPEHVRARAPASTANLGPGFDVLALALDLYVEVEVESAPRLTVRAEGEGAELADDAGHLAARVAIDVAGHDHLAITVRSDIPGSARPGLVGRIGGGGRRRGRVEGSDERGGARRRSSREFSRVGGGRAHRRDARAGRGPSG